MTFIESIGAENLNWLQYFTGISIVCSIVFMVIARNKKRIPKWKQDRITDLQNIKLRANEGFVPKDLGVEESFRYREFSLVDGYVYEILQDGTEKLVSNVDTMHEPEISPKWKRERPLNTNSDLTGDVSKWEKVMVNDEIKAPKPLSVRNCFSVFLADFKARNKK